MKASAASKWPYDPAGHSVAESIDWMRADPAVFASDDTRWKRVCQADAKRLMEDPRLSDVWNSLSADLQERLTLASHGGEREPKMMKEKSEKRSIKDELLDKIEAIMDEAAQNGDSTAQLRGVELTARLHTLLTLKPVEDRVVNISVVTGVPR